MTGRVVGRERRDPNDLTLSPNNVRKELNEDYLKQMEESIKTTKEVLSPIIINTKNQVVAGQHRWLVAKKLGMKIECIIKEYENPYEEILDSFIENYLHRDISSREKGEAIIELKDKYDFSFREIAKLLGLPTHSSVIFWYKKVKGPKALSEEEMKKEIKEKKKSTKKKKKKKKKTIEEIVEESEEQKKIREAYAKARELYNTFGLRTCMVLGKILDHPMFRENIWKSLKLLEYARDYLPLRELENILKNLKVGIEPDLEYLKKVYSSKQEYTMRALRLRKDQIKRAKPILKRRKMDLEHMIEDALEDWIKKWENPENWETETYKPKVFE